MLILLAVLATATAAVEPDLPLSQLRWLLPEDAPADEPRRDRPNGRVVVHCVFDTDAKPADCAVISEEPAGAGLGADAVQMVEKMRAEPTTVDGAAVAGRAFSMALKFEKPIENLHFDLPRSGSLYQQTPSADDFATEYPDKAISENRNGNIVVDCIVYPDGSLKTCLVASEQPLNYGFGEATLALTTRFRVKPKLPNGTPTACKQIRLPIRFNLGSGRDAPDIGDLPPPPVRPVPADCIAP